MQRQGACSSGHCPRLCFNPHPARRPDATSHDSSSTTIGGVVSILIRPEGRMQLRLASPINQLLQVSILIRPEGRMQHARVQRMEVAPPSFNPHPARRPDATRRARRVLLRSRDGFNPHPARRPDATTRTWITPRSISEFQSSSGQKAGCNPIRQRHDPGGEGFNPHPARRPDATPVSEFPICSARTSRHRPSHLFPLP